MHTYINICKPAYTHACMYIYVRRGAAKKKIRISDANLACSNRTSQKESSTKSSAASAFNGWQPLTRPPQYLATSIGSPQTPPRAKLATLREALRTPAARPDSSRLLVLNCKRQHTSAYARIRQHMSAYVSIRQHTSAYRIDAVSPSQPPPLRKARSAPPGLRDTPPTRQGGGFLRRPF
jgi:hypothetical protein